MRWQQLLPHLRFEIIPRTPFLQFPPAPRHGGPLSRWMLKRDLVEHRLFSEMSRNWSGCPLESFDLILNYLASTLTGTALAVGRWRATPRTDPGIERSPERAGPCVSQARTAPSPCRSRADSPPGNNSHGTPDRVVSTPICIGGYHVVRGGKCSSARQYPRARSGPIPGI